MRIIITNSDKTIMVNVFTGNPRLVEDMEQLGEAGRIEIATRSDSGHTWGPPEKGGVSIER